MSITEATQKPTLTGSAQAKERGTPPSDDAAHILIIDDDSRIRSLLKKYLADNGYRVSTAASGADARTLMEGLSFDLLVVDVMMPGETGLELTADLRSRSNIPILMLTALADSSERIIGLEAGADDYLPKPFEPRELLLRINNILKRAPSAPTTPEEIAIGDLTFHIVRGELRRGEETVHLTERERDLLRVFAKQRGETVSRYDLIDDGSTGNERAIDVQINRLRRKIENDPANPMRLQTVRGVGYVLMVE